MVSFSWPKQTNGSADAHAPSADEPDLTPAQAEEILQGLAGVFNRHAPSKAKRVVYPPEKLDQGWSKDGDSDAQLPNIVARYRALVEQIPGVVFIG